MGTGTSPDKPDPKTSIIAGVDGKMKATKVINGRCRGCEKYFGLEGMSATKNFWHIDDGALDNIRYSASKQGKFDWYSGMRNVGAKVELALSEYHERFPDLAGIGTATGKKLSKVPASITFQVLEYVIASTKAFWQLLVFT